MQCGKSETSGGERVGRERQQISECHVTAPIELLVQDSLRIEWRARGHSAVAARRRIVKTRTRPCGLRDRPRTFTGSTAARLCEGSGMTSVKEELELGTISSPPPCDEGAIAVAPVSKQPTSPPQTAEADPIDEMDDSSTALDSRALWSLLAQHLSSSWGQRCYEFAS